MTWARAKEGYYQIDHRASPGTKAVPGGTQLEAPTATCCHCNAPFPFNVKDRGKIRWCRRCNDYVCNDPACLECRPFTHQLDQQLEEINSLIQSGRV